MNETENPVASSKSFPRWVINIETVLFLIGFAGIIGLFSMKLLGKVQPLWLSLVITLGIYIGPSIPLVYKFYKLAPRLLVPLSLKLAIAIFLVFSMMHWYVFLAEVLETNTYQIGNLLISILFSNMAFGLANQQKGWWITAIILTLLQLIFVMGLFIIRFNLLLVERQQFILELGQIILFLFTFVILITPQTQKLFRKPSLPPQLTSA